MSFVFEGETVAHNMLGIEPPRHEYVACISDDGKVDERFMFVT